MFSSNLIRWGSVAFVLAGAVRLALGLLIVGVGHQAETSDFVLVIFIVVLLLTAAGLVGLHTLQKESYGLMGRAGFYAILAAIAARALGAVVLLYVRAAPTLLASALGSGIPGWLVLGGTWLVNWGFWFTVVGFVLYGAATLRGRMLPRWYGVLLIVFMPLAAAFEQGLNSIWEGLALLLLGYVLWLQREASTDELRA